MESELFDPDDIKISCSGIWKTERDHSILYFGIKLENNSEFNIYNLKFFLHKIPIDMKLEPKQIHRIPNLNPKANISVYFRLIPGIDYIFDTLEGFVSYRDLREKINIRDIEPYEIEFQRDFYTPNKIFIRNLNQKVKSSSI